MLSGYSEIPNNHSFIKLTIDGILPYRQFGGKILYSESDIEQVLQSCYRGKF